MSRPSMLCQPRYQPSVDAPLLTPREHIAAIALVILIVEATVLNAQDVDSLYRKLIVATRSLQAGNRQAAASQIRAFMLHVETLMRSGRLSGQDGNRLLRP